MKYIYEFGRKTSLRRFEGDCSNTKARDRDHHYDWVKATRDSEGEIETVASRWSKGFKELFPDEEFVFLQISKNIKDLIKKVKLLEERKTEVSKFKFSIKELKEDFLEISVIRFIIDLKLGINEYSDYFEPVEEEVLVEELISLNKVFDYIKRRENRGALSNIFPQSNKGIYRWKTGHSNMTIKSLLKIKSQMKNDEVDGKKINTYILLLYICTIIKVEDEIDFKEDEKVNKIDWNMLINVAIPLLLYHSEEISTFFKDQKNKK